MSVSFCGPAPDTINTQYTTQFGQWAGNISMSLKASKVSQSEHIQLNGKWAELLRRSHINRTSTTVSLEPVFVPDEKYFQTADIVIVLHYPVLCMSTIRHWTAGGKRTTLAVQPFVVREYQLVWVHKHFLYCTREELTWRLWHTRRLYNNSVKLTEDRPGTCLHSKSLN